MTLVVFPFNSGKSVLNSKFVQFVTYQNDTCTAEYRKVLLVIICVIYLFNYYDCQCMCLIAQLAAWGPLVYP